MWGLCRWEQLERVSEFKWLRCVLDETGTDGAEYRRKVVSGRKAAGALRYRLVLLYGS